MLNLKYGQQAVSRGFITPQRLQQVLAKQRQLADQGKKVSVRMILEKSKLLTPDQLDQLDRDLNIKVVKKKTSNIQKSAIQQRQPARPVQSISAENFMGDEALPDVSGTKDANPDATIYSPPPPDMQERIRQEREKAKAAVRQKNDAMAGGSGRPAAQPARPQAAPQRQQPGPQFAEPMMEPEMEPEPFGEPAPELERMDSSPKLESLAAEYQGIQAPEDEALPSLEAGGFDQFGEAPPQAGFGDLAPQAEGFDQMGEAPQGGDMYSGTAALGAEPEPAGNWGEEPSATPFAEAEPAPMDATLYSPPPSSMAPEPAPLAQSFDSFGEDDAPAAPAFGDDAGPGGDLSATLYSPPPADFQAGRQAPEMAPEREAEPAMAEPFGEAAEPFAEAQEPAAEPEPVAPRPSVRKQPPGKKVVDDFADAGAPPARELDDVPTVKPRGEPVHPLRRGVSSEINALEATKPPKGKTSKREPAAPPPAPSVELPSDDEPAGAKVPPRGKTAPTPSKPAKSQPVAVEAAEAPKAKRKSGVLLLFVLLLLIVIGGLVVPVVPEAQNAVPQLRELRNHEKAHTIYDKVEQWANWLRGQMNLPPWKTGKGSVKPGITENPEGAPPADGGTGEKPADGGKGEKPADGGTGEKPADSTPDAEAQWRALYKPGAYWITKLNMGMEMWTKTEVISVEGTKARVRMLSKMKAEDEFGNANESDVEFKKPEGDASPDPKWKELGKGEETVNGIECTWIEGEYNGARIKSWTAKKTGLSVKSEMAQGTTEVIEFKEGQ